MNTCIFCRLNLSNMSIGQPANHVRWCKLNPKRAQYIEEFNKKKNIHPENRFTKARKENREIPTAWNKGMVGLIGTPHTEEAKEKIRQKALASKHRRLVRSIREYVRIDGSIVMLDSSWEELLAKRLDSLNIEWVRPESIEWIDKNNRKRRYFSDFYLPKYNIFLDPKNSLAAKQQSEKIAWLKENIKNLIFLLSKEEIEKFIP